MSSPIGRVDTAGHWVTAICFNQPQGGKKAEQLRCAMMRSNTRCICVQAYMCPLVCLHVLEERSRTLVATGVKARAFSEVTVLSC